ncbi:MAG: hypothetical protein ACQESP_11095 [Candidatus Muiribacteriota bacterium]
MKFFRKARIFSFLIFTFLFIFNINASTFKAETSNFIFYYNSEKVEFVKEIASFAEKKLNQISNLIDYEHKKKIVVFLNFDNDSRGGSVSPFKKNIDMGFFSDPKKNYTWQELFTHELIHVIQFNIPKNNYSGINYYIKMGGIPLWFYEGTAEFFSRDNLPFYLTSCNFYDNYKLNELNLFYFRNNYDRRGGYFYSTLFFHYLEKKYSIDKIIDYFRNGFYGANFKKNFKKYFKDLNKEYIDFLDFAEKNYKINTPEKAELIKLNFDIVENPVFISNSTFYFKGKKDRKDNYFNLYKYDNHNIKLVFENVHSFSFFNETLYISSLQKQKNKTLKYQVFKKEKSKKAKKLYYGIYPHRKNNFFTYSTGYDEVVLINFEKKERKVFRGFYSKLTDNFVYFFEPSKKRLSRRNLNTFEKEVVYEYDNTGFHLDFFENNPVINVYENNNFKLIEIDSETLVKTVVFDYFCDDFFFYDDNIYFTTFIEGRKLIKKQCKEKINKKNSVEKFYSESFSLGKPDFYQDDFFKTKPYKSFLVSELLIPSFNIGKEINRLGFISSWSDKLSTEKVFLRKMYNFKTSRLNFNLKYFSKRLWKYPVEFEWNKYDYYSRILNSEEYLSKNSLNLNFEKRFDFNTKLKSGLFYESHGLYKGSGNLFDGKIWGFFIQLSYKDFYFDDDYYVSEEDLRYFDFKFKKNLKDSNFYLVEAGFGGNTFSRGSFKINNHFEYKNFHSLNIYDPLILMSSKRDFGIRGISTELYADKLYIYRNEFVYPLKKNYNMSSKYFKGLNIYLKVFHDILEAELGSLNFNYSTTGAGFEFVSFILGKVPVNFGSYYIENENNKKEAYFTLNFFFNL